MITKICGCGNKFETDNKFAVRCPDCTAKLMNPSGKIDSRPASQKQIDYIRKLGGSVSTGLTMTAASKLIDDLKNRDYGWYMNNDSR